MPTTCRAMAGASSPSPRGSRRRSWPGFSSTTMESTRGLCPVGSYVAADSGDTRMTTTMPVTIELETHAAKEVVDITARVEALIDGVRGGSCHLFLKHTTAGLMVVTSEKDVPIDIMDILQSLTPQ